MEKTSKIRIHRQKRNNFLMRLTPVGLVVFIPERYHENNELVQSFIQKGIKQLGIKYAPNADQTLISTPEELRKVLYEWAEKMQVAPNRIQLRDMYRKWGSCSSNGNITLNNALCRVPKPLAEYVIVHELIHLRIMNHGKDFKAAMTHWMPDWKERQKAIDSLIGQL